MCIAQKGSGRFYSIWPCVIRLLACPTAYPPAAMPPSIASQRPLLTPRIHRGTQEANEARHDVSTSWSCLTHAALTGAPETTIGRRRPRQNRTVDTITGLVGEGPPSELQGQGQPPPASSVICDWPDQRTSTRAMASRRLGEVRQRERPHGISMPKAESGKAVQTVRPLSACRLVAVGGAAGATPQNNAARAEPRGCWSRSLAEASFAVQVPGTRPKMHVCTAPLISIRYTVLARCKGGSASSVAPAVVAD